MEAESDETVELEQKVESTEKKVPEQETVSEKTKEATAETLTNDASENNDPKWKD